MKTADRRSPARAYVAAIPGAVSGAGGHSQTFAVACALVHGFALPEYEAVMLLREFNARCQPPWSEAELQHKIQSAMLASHSKPRGHLLGSSGVGLGRDHCPAAPPVRPALDPTTATENFLRGFRCDEVDVWEASPIRPADDWTQDAFAVLECLFRAGEQINFVTAFKEAADKNGKPKASPIGSGETVERDALLARWQNAGLPQSKAGGWLRMNSLDGRGVGDANVTAFRFALVECDAVPLELQLPLLAKLPLPLAVILTSGGRSLHAWVKVDAENAEDYKQTVARMFALLAKFGVDSKNKNPSRLSRLPGVVRSIGALGDGRQRLLFLDPQPEQKAIL
jgi:hypothetical protein